MSFPARVDRFVLEREIGSGGMGRVFRALDSATGSPVALKKLRAEAADERERFLVEAAALAELDHPGIVRHVAHGVVQGEPYLAMEWLEGEPLSERLLRGPLSFAEALRLARRVAEALAAVHAQGIVHRDLKPSNLILVGQSLDDVRLIDFGVVRRVSDDRRLTGTGRVVGTPQYMAPEQARARADLDPRVDVFALGAVLFECLTGSPAFSGPGLFEVFAQILLQDVPSLAASGIAVPAWFDDLVGRMLAKDRHKRPDDGAALLTELLAEASGALGRPAPPEPPAITTAERRVLCLLIVGRRAADPLAETQPAVDSSALVAQVAELASDQGVRVERLVGGTVLAVVEGSATASDLALRGARFALSVRERLATVPIAMACGRAGADELSVGDVARRAAALSDQSEDGTVMIDQLSASLISRCFRVEERESGWSLEGPHRDAEPIRRVLGKATAFVGRDAELAALSAMFDEVVREREPRAALITAPAGGGKTRLRLELLRAVGARHEAVRWLAARGDALGAKSPFALVSQAIESAAGIESSQPSELRRAALRSLLAADLAYEPLAWAVEFLGEIAGAPVESGASQALVAARRDPRLMSDGVRRAFVEWLAAMSRSAPVALVIDDLHWGDTPSVELVRAALRTLPTAPLAVVAFGRPECTTAFPALASGREARHMPLAALSRRASERLAADVLGEDADAETLSFIAERGDGNPFFVEELVREISRRRAGDSSGTFAIPESVLGMLQARLDALGADQKRILRAASVFGERFWRAGVQALVGSESLEAIEDALDSLCGQEVILRSPSSRFGAEPELVFRHALVRDAAYATLAERDRTEAHGRAAAWLERAGERDVMVLAEHFAACPEPARAVPFFLRAAQDALDGDDLEMAIERVERGALLGASGATLGELWVVEAQARAWRGEHERALASAERATAALRGGDGWVRAMGEAVAAAARLGRTDRLLELSEELVLAQAAGAVLDSLVVALCRTMVPLTNIARFDVAQRVLDRLGVLVSSPDVVGAYAAAQLFEAKGMLPGVQGDMAPFLAGLGAALDAYESAGATRDVATTLASLAWGHLQIGDVDGADARLARCASVITRTRAVHLKTWVLLQAGTGDALRGSFDDAVQKLGEVAAEYARQSSRRQEGMARSQLARAHLYAQRPADAEHEARRAADLLERAPGLLPLSLAVLARARVALGDPAEGEAVASDAAKLAKSASTRLDEGHVDLALVEALSALGRTEDARAALRAGLERLDDRASRLAASMRPAFLAMPEHRRLRALGEQSG